MNHAVNTCLPFYFIKANSHQIYIYDVDDPDAAVTTDPFINDDENLLFDANTHAEQVKQQRDVAHERQQIAIQEASNEHENRRFVFCFIAFF